MDEPTIVHENSSVVSSNDKKHDSNVNVSNVCDMILILLKYSLFFYRILSLKLNLHRYLMKILKHQKNLCSIPHTKNR
jgi:hypothetical protein